MKNLVHTLGSIKIGVALLVIVLVALATGTIIESVRNTETAGRLVYDAPWFRILIGLYAFSILCSLIDLFPWGRHRIGFVLTHGSMLLILLGAATTLAFKVEGNLALWEGDQSATFVESTRTGTPANARTLALPFAVRLDAFEIDYYQGTRRPAMFRSRVTVTDTAGGRSFPAVIEMNRELSYAGYRLFQSGYEQGKDRDQTVLLVSRDPGEPIVFAGYVLLVGGMLTVLGIRIAQHRVPAARPAARAAVAALLFGAAALASGLASPASAAAFPDPGAAETLRRLPVQHDGRVMPLDTLARQAVWQVTGRSLWNGSDPVATVLGWTLDPDRWAAEPVVRLGGSLPAAIGVPPRTTYASFRDLVRNRTFLGLLDQARAAEEQGGALHGVLKDAQKVEERLLAMQGFLDGSVWRVLPDPSNPAAPWGAPPRIDGVSTLGGIMSSGAASALADPGRIEHEISYNRARPTRLAWWILAPAAVVSVLAWNSRRRVLDLLAVTGLVVGFAVMTWGIAVRWIVAARIPASNMYESLLFLGWGIGLFALAAMVILRNRLVVINATAMSALTMALADLLPVDPFIHPMPPVLSGTPWLAIHVPIIMVSYSVLALGVVIAHMQIGVTLFAPARRDLAFRMNELLYWYLHVGSILLVAGILTGSIWAASSWGRYWGWDPKEVWSLVAFLAYVAILHGRFERLIGPFGVAALSIVAFQTILMTYLGVNFILAAGLHSYGFGGSGVVRWMLIVAAAEALFIALGYFAHTTERQTARPAAT